MSQANPPAEALPVDDLRDVPPTVLAMADRTLLRIHELLDGAPLALVVNAYRAGYADGRMEAAAAIRAFVEMKERSVQGCPPESAEAFRRNDAVLGAYRRAAEIAAEVKP